MLIVFGLLFAPLGGASAQGTGASGKPFPIQRTRPAPAPAAGDKLTNFVIDPSLEASYSNPSGAWAQSSSNFGSPLCTVADCGNGNGTAGPRSGSVWSWFGGVVFSIPGTVSPEVGTLSQNVIFPACGATLQFYFWIGTAQPGSDANDLFRVRVDGNTVFSANATQQGAYPS
jgi:hypothetical protein